MVWLVLLCFTLLTDNWSMPVRCFSLVYIYKFFLSKFIHFDWNLSLFLTDKEVVLPWCDQGVWDSEVSGHNLCSDIRYQQRQGRLPERTATAEARQRGHQHLRSMRAQPPRLLPILLSRLQGTTMALYTYSSYFSDSFRFNFDHYLNKLNWVMGIAHH